MARRCYLIKLKPQQELQVARQQQVGFGCYRFLAISMPNFNPKPYHLRDFIPVGYREEDTHPSSLDLKKALLNDFNNC